MFQMVGDVSREDHFNDDLAYVPVLSLAKEFKDVVLGVEKELESDCTVMVFKDALVVVSDGLGVLHGDEEGIVDAGM